MASTSPTLTLRHSRQTQPQRDFWGSPAKFRAFVGGVGSGKTRAGCVEVLRQPVGSTGMVLAPTYPMLRDATLRTFLELGRRGGVIRSFQKAEMKAELINGSTVLFRSSDDPDRLRGPNLGWFWLDEAAMMDYSVWLIMLGRLREAPGRAWVTTTPRGKNWLYKTFTAGGPDRKVIKADSRSNPFLPEGFVAELLGTYDHDFARQEVGGEFLDESFGQLIPDHWVERCAQVPPRPPRLVGHPRMGVDLGEGTGRNQSVLYVVDDAGIVDREGSSAVGIPEAALLVKRLKDKWSIRDSNIAYDANGRGKDLPKYLEPFGIDAVPYHGGGKGGARWANKRSRCAWRIRQRLDPERPDEITPARPSQSVWEADKPGRVTIQPPFALPADRPWWPRLAEELAGLKYEVDGKVIKLEPKEDFAERLGRSPDDVDALFMAFSVGEAV